MPIDDPNTWLQTASAVRTMIDSFRSAVGLVRETSTLSSSTAEQKEVIDKALTTASTSADTVILELAKSYGYPFCYCEFPPTIMLTVGYFPENPFDRAHKAGAPAFECPKCGYNNSGGVTFVRTKPHPAR